MKGDLIVICTTREKRNIDDFFFAPLRLCERRMNECVNESENENDKETTNYH